MKFKEVRGKNCKYLNVFKNKTLRGKRAVREYSLGMGEEKFKN